MKIYNYHPETFEYINESLADESPLEPGVFLIPANATTKKTLPAKEGFTCYFINGEWVYKEVVVEENNTIEENIEQPPIDPVLVRRYMYQTESDPLFFKWQRGEATEQEWIDKVNEIKSRVIV